MIHIPPLLVSFCCSFLFERELQLPEKVHGKEQVLFDTALQCFENSIEVKIYRGINSLVLHEVTC
jgi:hypothetical protein|uniref:Uncharacterized protein n=1 Tax=Zea mays TaxID=4577 RepID=C0PK07_MAIZE|nr:unknown [Zea mays]